MDIRNIAIIAHVDHGKTTLVDGMLKQTHTFRQNQAEMSETTILDRGELEKEKGITILAKNTSVIYKEVKINIIDTPGHADFSGEVERVLNMADGALLIIDAAEGPLAQTQFVLAKALEYNLKIIVVINKIDRKDQRAKEVLMETEELILKMAKHDSHLDFPVIYAVGREGKAWSKYPLDFSKQANLEPLFECILENIPPPKTKDGETFKMLVSTLDFDNYKGAYAIGKVSQGKVKNGQELLLLSEHEKIGKYKVTGVFTSVGLGRQEVEESTPGDIIAVSGITDVAIGQTLSDLGDTTGYPMLVLSEPIVTVNISANTSPVSGREGKFVTARQLEQRLIREKKTNIGMKIEGNPGGGFDVSGRGELHLSILLETLRREGFEMQVGKPEIIFKDINGEHCEPYEEATVKIDNLYMGVVMEEIGKRKGTLIDVINESDGASKLIFKISSRNLLGFRSSLISRTGGKGQFFSRLLGYEKTGEKAPKFRNGVIIAFEKGTSKAYSLENAQERGVCLIGPGEEVYEGMVVGINNRDEDMEINVCKGKKLTNMHTENSDAAIQLDPPLIMSLEQSLDFIEDDELLEITPKSLRIRKLHLDKVARKRNKRDEYHQSQGFAEI